VDTSSVEGPRTGRRGWHRGGAKPERPNRYTVNGDLPLRHPLERNHSVRELIELVGAGKQRRSIAS
jgi:hypothetical protein